LWRQFERKCDLLFGVAGLFHRYHLRQGNGFIMPDFQFKVEQNT
jgi:hypothetical protein